MRPPALGGKRVGTLATRSPHRPSRIGLCLGMVLRVRCNEGEPGEVLMSGCDAVDGSPVLDIKPWLPAVDVPREFMA